MVEGRAGDFFSLCLNAFKLHDVLMIALRMSCMRYGKGYVIVLSVGRKKWDQYQYLGICPPTPPLTQQKLVDNKLGWMLG